MKVKRTFQTFLLAVIACVLPTQFSLAEEKVVLLRNGGVLRGRVVELNNQYLISPDPDTEIRIDKFKVEMICGSIREAYKQKKETLIEGDYDQIMKLAKWCLKHELLAEAQVEILQLNPRTNRNPEVFRLIRSANALSKQLKARKEQSNTKSSKEFTKNENEIRDEINNLKVPDISTSAFAHFVQEVQPRLLNSCATSGCHHSRSNLKFKLIADSDRHLSRTSTLYNLVKSYELASNKENEEATLLKFASTAHGKLQRPRFRKGTKHFQKLKEWVQMLEEKETEDSFVQRASAEMQLRPADATVRNSRIVEFLDGYSPIDRHDPEIFNRIFASREKKKDGVTSMPTNQKTIEIRAPKRLRIETNKLQRIPPNPFKNDLKR